MPVITSSAKQNGRNRQLEIEQAREKQVEHTAEVAAEEPDQRADHQRNHERDQRQFEHRSAPVEHATQDVAAERVRPEQVRRGRAGVRMDADLRRVVGCDERAERDEPEDREQEWNPEQALPGAEHPLRRPPGRRGPRSDPGEPEQLLAHRRSARRPGVSAETAASASRLMLT